MPAGQQEVSGLSNYFDGYYYKHQKGSQTLCLIVGKSNSEKFIQVITNDFSVKVPFQKGNHFSKKGVVLDIETKGFSLIGKIRYGELAPIKYDIMGPFRFFPMECRHGIISMRHRLNGKVILNGEVMDFTGGTGYIEKDSGRSFPSSYTWIQANEFVKCRSKFKPESDPCSIMAAVAKIPFMGMYFRGCICVIQYRGREYRLATYLGVRVISCTPCRIVLKQGKYWLEIRIKKHESHKLRAPQDGEMTRTILEAASCRAEFIFGVRGRCLFHLYSENASFEWESESMSACQCEG